LTQGYEVECHIKGPNKVEFVLNNLPPHVTGLFNLPEKTLSVMLTLPQDGSEALNWEEPPARQSSVPPPTVKSTLLFAIQTCPIPVVALPAGVQVLCTCALSSRGCIPEPRPMIAAADLSTLYDHAPCRSPCACPQSRHLAMPPLATPRGARSATHVWAWAPACDPACTMPRYDT
jgi:hypothetical protein